MNIVLAQQNYHIGNFSANTAKIIGAISAARDQGADLIVFSELCVCGYPPRDFLDFADFIRQCYERIDQIRVHADTLGVILGSPSRNPQPEGKSLFNSAWFLYEGKVQQVIHKTLLPNYDIFDEYRYFEPGYEWSLVPFRGLKIALTICEDIWNLGDNPLYRLCPMDRLMPDHPDLMINISASPFDYDHHLERLQILRANVLKYRIPMIYCNAVGSQTEVVFDGNSLVLDAQGRVVRELPAFREAMASVQTGEILDPAPGQVPRPALLPDPKEAFEESYRIGTIHDGLVLGIRDYFSKMGFSRAILGSSGGIDSAVTLVLACEALGKDQVTAVRLPGPYSSPGSLQDARELSARLGNPQKVIRIDDLFTSFLKTLEPEFRGLSPGLAEENIQSRIRGNLLMALANKFGFILLNTSNKSELATGYGTLYGDMAGGLGVIGDVYKMQIYALARYLNRDREIIPQSILNKAPTAELRPGQKDTDSLPDYPVLDPILYQYIEKSRGPAEIIALGYEAELVRRILRLVNTNEYKRNQFCPIIRVSSKAFGMGRRVPIVGTYLS